MLQVVNFNLQRTYDTITLSWDLPTEDYEGFRVYKVGLDGRVLLDTLSALISVYDYSIPVSERGSLLAFGVSVYYGANESDLVSEEVSTIPNPITNVVVEDNSNNTVKLKWDEPVDKPRNIKGYRITRFETGSTEGVVLNIASIGRYVDIGNFYKAPIGGKSYDYHISTVNYQDVASSNVLITVLVKAEEDKVVELERKTIAVSGEGKYRIKSVTDDGGCSQWFTFQKLIFDSNDLPYEKRFRIRAVSTDGAKSLPLITRSIVCIHNFAEQYPKFRLRAVDTDGLESMAITVLTQDLMCKKQPIMLNNSDEAILDSNGNTMVGKW